jgi:hypothetical protein
MGCNKRVVTSAIDGLTVADVRRNLDMLRRRWKQQEAGETFYLTDPLGNGFTADTFAVKFIIGHHFKRHHNTKSGTKQAGV